MLFLRFILICTSFLEHQSSSTIFSGGILLLRNSLSKFGWLRVERIGRKLYEDVIARGKLTYKACAYYDELALQRSLEYDTPTCTQYDTTNARY